MKKKLETLMIVALALLMLTGSLFSSETDKGTGANAPKRFVFSDYAANFGLSSFQTNSYSMNGMDHRAHTFFPQHQPFEDASGSPLRLLNDDPKYNKKSAIWMVGLRVVSANIVTWAMDRYVFNYSWSHVGPKTWKRNFKDGWEWDTDRFGMNFFFHPYSGATYFNSARANGYSYLESVPFVFMGSLMWEYLGETTRPAYNDIINTTVSGALFGEILYRLSSKILDDRSTGGKRFLRELAAAILSPGRAISRFLQGKMAKVTQKEVYQKEPVNITLALGAHVFNKLNRFGSTNKSAILGIHIDYGDPFEIRPRKPFDFFKARLELNYGKNINKKYLANVIAYGLLFGKTIHSGKLEMLIGAFQHYNYWDSTIFKIGVLGFGGGIISKWQFSKNSNFQSAFHLGFIPLSASNSPHIDIVEEGVHLRNYDYSGGAETKFEGTLNVGQIGQVTTIYYLYWLHTYVGPGGNKVISIFKPRIAIKLSNNLSIGYEYLYYHKNSYFRYFSDIKRSNSQQKIYLMLYF